MEDAETVEEALGERPALAPVEQDGEDERGVDRALGGKRDIPRAEKALPKSAKSSARRLDPAVDVEPVAAVAVEVAPKILGGQEAQGWGSRLFIAPRYPVALVRRSGGPQLRLTSCKNESCCQHDHF